MAGITSDNKGKIHQQFVTFGIDKAVEKIIELEKSTIDVLAFSIGGTIAWKAALKGVVTRNLTLVSATRLRLETQIPDCKISLYYGEFDNYKPTNLWLENHISVILDNAAHEFYTEKNKATLICSEIIRNI